MNAGPRKGADTAEEERKGPLTGNGKGVRRVH
jgi:hypothetical protein